MGTIFFRLLHPWLSLGVSLLYLLGAGLARYLGATLDWTSFWSGLAWVVLIQSGGSLLLAYFDPRLLERLQELQPRSRLSDTPGSPIQTGPSPLDGFALVRYQRAILVAAFACLAVAGSLSILVALAGRAGSALLVWLLLGALGAVFYSAPPLRLGASGYGELLLAVLLGQVVPAIGFILQEGGFHPLLSTSSLPLVVLALAMWIALDFPRFSRNNRLGVKTLVIRMGWKNGMLVHNLLILSAYFLLGLAVFGGLPWFVTLAALASLPVGLLQVWQMWRISQGQPPNWPIFTLNAVATFGSMAYLIAYSYWTH
jgi:1,4-dihydroxy-2-naphthoate octaprenyltransferase